MATLKIKNNSGFFNSFDLSSRTELSNEEFQSLLAKFHKADRTIKCGCYPQKDIWLSVCKFNGKEQYYLRSYPKVPNHADDCIFNNNANELFDDENMAYSIKIFKEPKRTNEKTTESLEKFLVQNNYRTYTYNAFCNDIISRANAMAMNIANKKNDRFSENFNYRNFAYAVRESDIKIKNVGVFKDLANHSDIYPFCGITYDDLPNLISGDDKLININVFNSKFELKTTRKRLSIAVKSLKIFRNYIKPPYFIIAMIENRVAIRLFVAPIYFNMRNIVFIESEFEMDFAKELLDNGKVFFKPFSNEVLNLNRSKFPKFWVEYRPDFFVFNENNIEIIELCGFKNDEYYMRELRDKENRYKQLIFWYKKQNTNITFSYKRISKNGIEMEIK